ncbi:Major Facilitator Superfamily protein [Shimia gijangensis]|uniref:Major Facilitator Superfamily protein n=1 Tax=Shimia gijangensis TaxID=1470563 RepID=A0A1M6K8Q1_9RHOB|nr:MFS transporter [Shimia gijangensis]SHJ55237.1 Major Facilitator Superfamily protein [Shimia gijangensis]
MRPDLILLCFAYVLSQFFRAFLAVLTKVLDSDIGATSEDLAFASGVWFLVFAAMQIPVGAALDRIGPRLTSSVLLFIGGGGGALLFSYATTPAHITLAMGLIGIGCSPVLMASYYIFARSYPAAKFATLAALMLGVGSVGNLVASYPTAWAAEVIGWRMTLVALAIFSAATAVGLGLMVKDPPKAETTEKGSVLDLLKMPALWLMFPLMFVNYIPAAGIRGLWIGPYLSDVFDVSTSGIGTASLMMGVAMIAGTLSYGPADRIFGTRKWVVVMGNTLVGLACFALAVWISTGVVLSIAIMALIGFCGASFPVIIAHARSFIPPHLTGRGVTLLNLFGIGGVGVMQSVSGKLHGQMAETSPILAYQTLFAFFGVLSLLGVLIYLFSQDRTD